MTTMMTITKPKMKKKPKRTGVVFKARDFLSCTFVVRVARCMPAGIPTQTAESEAQSDKPQRAKSDGPHSPFSMVKNAGEVKASRLEV